MSIALDLIVVFIILFSVFLSAKRGFINVVVEVVGLVAAIVLTFSISSPLSDFTYDKIIEPPLIKAANFESYENTQQFVQNVWDSLPSLITANSDKLGFDSQNFNQSISENMQDGAETAIKTVSRQMIRPVTIKILNLLYSVILMIVLFFLVKIIAKAVNKLFSFSLIGKVNRTLGGILGAFKGAVFAVFFCTLVAFIVSFTANGFLIFTKENIDNSTVFKFFTDIIPFKII